MPEWPAHDGCDKAGQEGERREHPRVIRDFPNQNIDAGAQNVTELVISDLNNTPFKMALKDEPFCIATAALSKS